MAPSLILKAFLFTAVALVPAVYAQSNQALNFVFSSTDFNSIDADGDPAPADPISKRDTAYGSGFYILDENDGVVYSSDAPGGYAPCFNTDGGRTFTVSGGCFSGAYQFHCEAAFDGTPDNCAVMDTVGSVLGSADGTEDQNFIGIAVTTDGQCGSQWVLRREENCQPGGTGFTIS